ncbi:MAG: LysR family transcriptional regulator [Pigmentiphaga sp.]|nr:LysR family transcriptional regulator [Pigmentiphaga sp.]
MREVTSPRNLRVFLAVYEEQSGARAAERLLRAPSAITRVIQEIESHLGLRLFDRLPVGMSPTAAGHLVYQRAKAIEQELLQARKELLEHGAARNAPIFSMMVSIPQMETLIKLSELGQMSSVAESLGVSQPAISDALRRLEESMNLQLFERSSRRLSITLPARLLVFRLRRVLSEIRRLSADVSQLASTVQGEVVISVLPSSKTVLMPKAIARFVGAHPNVQVSVVDAPFEVLFADMRSGEIDFIYTGIDAKCMHPDLNVEPLSTDRLVVVARTDHPLALKPSLTAQDLKRYPWILRDPSSPSRQLLNRAFKEMGIDAPTIAVHGGDLGLLRGLLLYSEMLTAVSPHNLSPELDLGNLTILDVELPGCQRNTGFVWRKDLEPSAACLQLMRNIRHEVLRTEPVRIAPGAP